MHERGIDGSTEFPKPWNDETVRAADIVITMGCGGACPVDLAGVRPIRDEIERRVRNLLDGIGLAVPAGG